MADYIPDQDVTQVLPDGRTIIIAPAGVPVPEARAKELGLIKDPQPQGPTETKDAEPAPDAGVTDTNAGAPQGEPLPVGKQAKASKTAPQE